MHLSSRRLHWSFYFEMFKFDLRASSAFCFAAFTESCCGTEEAQLVCFTENVLGVKWSVLLNICAELLHQSTLTLEKIKCQKQPKASLWWSFTASFRVLGFHFRHILICRAFQRSYYTLFRLKKHKIRLISVSQQKGDFFFYFKE